MLHHPQFWPKGWQEPQVKDFEISQLYPSSPIYSQKTSASLSAIGTVAIVSTEGGGTALRLLLFSRSFSIRTFLSTPPRDRPTHSEKTAKNSTMLFAFIVSPQDIFPTSQLRVGKWGVGDRVIANWKLGIFHPGTRRGCTILLCEPGLSRGRHNLTLRGASSWKHCHLSSGWHLNNSSWRCSHATTNWNRRGPFWGGIQTLEWRDLKFAGATFRISRLSIILSIIALKIVLGTAHMAQRPKKIGRQTDPGSILAACTVWDSWWLPTCSRVSAMAWISGFLCVSDRLLKRLICWVSFLQDHASALACLLLITTWTGGGGVLYIWWHLPKLPKTTGTCFKPKRCHLPFCHHQFDYIRQRLDLLKALGHLEASGKDSNELFVGNNGLLASGVTLVTTPHN